MRKLVVGLALIAACFALVVPSLADRIGLLLIGVVAATLIGEILASTARNLEPAERTAVRAPSPHTLPYELAALDDEIRHSRTIAGRELSPRLQAIVQQLATTRLRSRHGLEVTNSEQSVAIRRMVSPRLWAIIEPRRFDQPLQRIPAAHLDELISELEAL